MLYLVLVNKEWADTNRDPLSFKDSVLNFKRLDVYMDSIKIRLTRVKKDSSQLCYVLDILKFEDNGNVRYYKDAKNVVLCGNGIISLKRGIWNLEGNKIELNMDGHIFAEGDFHYRNEYLLKFIDSNTMQLRLTRVIESKFVKG